MSFTNIILNAANMNPVNLQGLSDQCQWNEELIPYYQKAVTVDSIAQPFDIIGQPICSIEPSPFSATFETFPLSNLFIDRGKNFFILCPEMEPVKEINWVYPSWETQFTYQQIPIVESYKKAIEKVSTFKNLSSDWDSFHAKEIDINCINRVSKILIDLSEWMGSYEIPSPFVAPRSDGSIQMEWERGSRYLELGIGPDTSEIDFFAMDENHNGKTIDYEGVIELEGSIRELLQWFIKGEAEEITKLFPKIR